MLTKTKSAVKFDEDDTFNPHWRQNLAVCIVGSFTTVVAMTILLPFLPLYVEQLGVHDDASIVRWSGVAYGSTFFTAALVAPLWGRLADKYGRKLMMMRASLGMAIAMSLIGMAHDIWQLVALRLLAGLLGGYSSGSTIIVATQTPKARVGWALGMLASGVMAGNLVGPLVGGALAPLMGIRQTFLAAGAIIFVAFLGTAFLIREDITHETNMQKKAEGGWAAIPARGPLCAMLATGLLLMFANMSIEPIITVYVAQLVHRADQVTIVSGFAMSATALGSILSAARLGQVADRVGHWTVIIGSLSVAAVLLVPQAFVNSAWQLVVLRFLMGIALGGLLPCVASVIRNSVPDKIAGNMLGYSTSAQCAGQVAGPLVGGVVGGALGMQAVFLGTAVLLACGAGYNIWMKARYSRQLGHSG